MSEPQPPQTVPFDPTQPQGWADRLRELPHRATVAFAIRCARRVEPHPRLGQLRAEAFAGGIELPAAPVWGNQAAACTACTAAHADAAPESGRKAAAHAASFAALVDPATAEAALADLVRLRTLDLGNPDEPGRPVRWNDPRLGPLWPAGEPAWFTEAVRLCRELDDRLRSLPAPDAPPDDPIFVAQVEQWVKAQQLHNEGKFDAYRGEYVIFWNGTVFGHSRDLCQVLVEAEEAAARRGLTPDQLIHYFVPGE